MQTIWIWSSQRTVRDCLKNENVLGKFHAKIEIFPLSFRICLVFHIFNFFFSQKILFSIKIDSELVFQKTNLFTKCPFLFQTIIILISFALINLPKSSIFQTITQITINYMAIQICRIVLTQLVPTHRTMSRFNLRSHEAQSSFQPCSDQTYYNNNKRFSEI